ncbi:MAG: hypothetical protein ABIP94_22265 [Planctomycetota bacterium]
MNRNFLAFLFSCLAPLSAQTIDTLGGTANAPSLLNRAKASLFGVNTTVQLLQYEVYLDVPGPETLTFFAYRHHSRTGAATLAWTLPVQVTGGTGPGWYSTGPISLPLVAGNHYALGVSWTGTLTYYWSNGTTGTPVSFGTWQRAHTLTNPLAPTLTLPVGVDAAQYYQRLTTVATPSVVNVGTGCSATALVPRLVANNLFLINTATDLQLVDAAPTSIAAIALANGLTVSVPFPLFGCTIWLNTTGPLVLTAAVTSATGVANLSVSVPNNPALIGTAYSAQGLVFAPSSIDVSNAVGFVVN